MRKNNDMPKSEINPITLIQLAATTGYLVLQMPHFVIFAGAVSLGIVGGVLLWPCAKLMIFADDFLPGHDKEGKEHYWKLALLVVMISVGWGILECFYDKFTRKRGDGKLKLKRLVLKKLKLILT
jgi:hypothetical protein